MKEPVALTTQSGIAHLQIDDGAVNAMSRPLISAVNAALDRVEADDQARALVISGRAGRFCAGFDLNAMGAGGGERQALVTEGGRLCLRLARFPLPVVLAANGHALALGAILLCCADRRIGPDGDYRIGMNEVGIGMVVPEFGTALAGLRLDRRWHHRAVILGEIMDPESALKAGFLDELAPRDEVVERALEQAASLSAYVDRRAFSRTRERIYGPALDGVVARLEEDVAGLLGGFT